MMTKVKRLIETSDIDNEFMREYNSMHKLMEDRQINDYYEARRHICRATTWPPRSSSTADCLHLIAHPKRGTGIYGLLETSATV